MINYTRWIYWMRWTCWIFLLAIVFAIVGIHRMQWQIMDNLTYASCDGYAYDREQAPELCR